MKTDITVKEYLEIRNEVTLFLEEKMRNHVSALDKLPNDEHRKKVIEISDRVYNKALTLEPPISNIVYDLAFEFDGLLKGFKERIKSLEGIRRKTISDSMEYKGDYEVAASKLCDTIRYTVVFKDDEYVDKVDKFLHEIEDKGYKVKVFKNNWGKETCQGFNVRLTMPYPNENELFEIQFHTPYGYQIKEGSTRDLYEVIRDDDLSEELIALKQKSDKLRKIFQKSIRIPIGALNYKFESREKKI